jgi:hypothetical protein
MEIQRTRDAVKILGADIEKIVGEHVATVTGRVPHEVKLHVTRDHTTGFDHIGAVTIPLKFGDEVEEGEAVEQPSKRLAVVLTEEERAAMQAYIKMNDGQYSDHEARERADVFRNLLNRSIAR